jgi:hypothetical protein
MKFFRDLSDLLKKDSDLLGRIALILGVFAVLALAIVLSGPKPDEDAYLLPTPTPVFEANANTVYNTTPLAFPFSEYATTTGVAVGASGVVIILVLGTAIELWRDRKERQAKKSAD